MHDNVNIMIRRPNTKLVTAVFGEGGGPTYPLKIAPPHNLTAKNKQRRGEWLLWVHMLLLPLWVKALSKTVFRPLSDTQIIITQLPHTQKWQKCSRGQPHQCS